MRKQRECKENMKRRAELGTWQSTASQQKKRRLTQTLTPAQTQAVKKIVQRTSDLKYTDFQDSVGVTIAGHLFPLLGNLVRGTAGLNNMDGNNLIPVGLTFRHYWTTTVIHNACRIIIFQWNDFSTPTLDAVLQDTTVANSLLPMQNSEIGNKMNLNILHDDFFVLAPTTPGTDNAVYYKKVFIPGSRMQKIRLNPSANQVTNGAIWALVVSDDAIAPSPAAFVSSRLSFTD